MDRLGERRPYWRKEADPDDELEQEAVEAFQDRHRSLADRVERLLIQLVVLGLVALALVQGLQLNRFTRLVAMEGVPVNEVADWSRSLGREPVQSASASAATMRVKVMSVDRRSAPGARLLVDGEPVGDFATGSVAVDVRPGQALIIDGRAHAEPLSFRVVEVTGVKTPALGTSVTTRGDQKRLGVVQAGGRP